jgi:hypothetical protein
MTEVYGDPDEVLANLEEGVLPASASSSSISHSRHSSERSDHDSDDGLFPRVGSLARDILENRIGGSSPNRTPKSASLKAESNPPSFNLQDGNSSSDREREKEKEREREKEKEMDLEFGVSPFLSATAFDKIAKSSNERRKQLEQEQKSRKDSPKK